MRGLWLRIRVGSLGALFLALGLLRFPAPQGEPQVLGLDHAPGQFCPRSDEASGQGDWRAATGPVSGPCDGSADEGKDEGGPFDEVFDGEPPFARLLAGRLTGRDRSGRPSVATSLGPCDPRPPCRAGLRPSGSRYGTSPAFGPTAQELFQRWTC